MARNKQASFAKRKREQERQAKAAEKRARRKARAIDKAENGGGGMMYADVSPQSDKPTDEEVMRAIERAMNPGKRLGRTSAVASSGSAKLFVGNVDYDTNEEELKALFVKAGFDVVTANVARDRATGQSRGFAFVELGSPAQAGEAISKMAGAEIHGRELRLSPADRGR